MGNITRLSSAFCCASTVSTAPQISVFSSTVSKEERKRESRAASSRKTAPRCSSLQGCQAVKLVSFKHSRLVVPVYSHYYMQLSISARQRRSNARTYARHKTVILLIHCGIEHEHHSPKTAGL